MSNKLVVFTVILIVAGACNLKSSQRQNWSAEDMAKRQTIMMQEALQLTEEQRSKIERINLKFADQFKKLRDNTQGDREKMRILRDDLRDAKYKELEAVLSTEQFEKYIVLEEERAKEMRNGHRGERGDR
ncbi:hypothetical protein KEM09_01975 [Carboxylicivirga mesophila]|uniref:Periplasmic heavy metal sensor n=2 Tax=Carboxylicivirga TaxID=1628153 RepID=A0A941IYA4_9BACT|nr:MULTISPECIES: hypothetical protein [Carboxylicivirga]MBR8535602.1 hypothetical protein [Carboxylicivirga sediminis]MBS2210147.1 hypothetical protein [Carboxylicivirga mesophila]